MCEIKPDIIDVEVKVLKKRLGIKKCTINVQENTKCEEKITTVYTNPIVALRLKIGNVYYLHINADNELIEVTEQPTLND